MTEAGDDESSVIAPSAPAAPTGSRRRSQWTTLTVDGVGAAVDSDRVASPGPPARVRHRAVLAVAAAVVLIAGVVFAVVDSTASTSTSSTKSVRSGSPAPSAVSGGSLVPLGEPITPASSRPATAASSSQPSPTAVDGRAPASPAVSASAPRPPAQLTFRLAGKQSNRCLDVPQSSTSNGTQVDIWDCNGDPNQVWTRTGSGQLTVYSGNDLMCLDAAFAGTTAGTYAIVWQCSSVSTRWNVNANGTITDVHSGLCLDVTQNGTVNGSPVELWTCNGGLNQVWRRY